MSFKECSVKNNQLALVGMCVFIETCILNATDYHARSDKNYPKWAEFLLLKGLSNTFFEAEMRFTTLLAFQILFFTKFSIQWDMISALLRKKSFCHFLDPPSFLRISCLHKKILIVARFYCLVMSTQVFLPHQDPANSYKCFHLYLFKCPGDSQPGPGLNKIYGISSWYS